MPKKKRRRKPRAAPRVHRPGTPPHAARDDGEPPLLDDVARMLGGPQPEELLHFASSLLAAVDPRADDPMTRAAGDTDRLTLADLVDSFVGVPRPETTALLAAFAAMVTDELVAQRIRRELASRGDRLPDWLGRLSPVTVERAIVMGHVLGDGDSILLDGRTGAGRPVTAIVYIDHNLGTVVKDGFVIHEPAAAAVASFRQAAGDDPDVTFTELDLADIRTRITDAIDHGAITYPPLESDSWPAARPLVEWVVRALPSGGTGYERPEYSDEDRDELTERFFASRWGRSHDEDDRQLFESLLWFGCDYGPGDPLRWSPVAVEILLADWLPRKVVADVGFLDRAPDLLRSLVRFAHDDRGIPANLTEETLAAVDRWEPEYRRTIRSPRPQGPAALMAAMGMPLDDDDLLSALGLPSHEESMLRLLRKAVGEDALDDLDTTPLDDEPLDLSGVAGDVRPVVAEVAHLTDACCDELLDVEHRTACRRLLADVAAARPDIFRRRARFETAAAAVVWIVVKANHGFSQAPGGFTAKALGEWFGVSGPSQRAATLLGALDLPSSRYGDVALGSPRYLVGSRRRRIAETRDRCRPEA